MCVWPNDASLVPPWIDHRNHTLTMEPSLGLEPSLEPPLEPPPGSTLGGSERVHRIPRLPKRRLRVAFRAHQADSGPQLDGVPRPPGPLDETKGVGLRALNGGLEWLVYVGLT